jgi:outer membrane protein, heavy metal efflux system
MSAATLLAQNFPPGPTNAFMTAPPANQFIPIAPIPSGAAMGDNPDPDDPFRGARELELPQLIAAVEMRNPSLQAAAAAYRAAAARYPQATALEDPMFGWTVSPQGVGRDDGGGFMVEAAQKLPWSGKRGLRGAAAAAEAEAMHGDLGDARLRVVEMARNAYFDYYLAARQAEVNAATTTLVQQFREIARHKYEVNQATEQDVLAADVDLAALETRRSELARDRAVAVARINTLLHRAADHPLVPPPADLPLAVNLPKVDSLEQSALRGRPDVLAEAARIHGEEANLALAQKEYYPDVEVVARYDANMPVDMRSQVGMNVNVPLWQARRSGAVREACERLQQRRAEYQDLADRVRYEVHAAYQRTVQAQTAVGLYRQRILPAAEHNVQSAQANYVSGKLDFLRLVDAQRQLAQQREMREQALADYHHRLAELERAAATQLR